MKHLSIVCTTAALVAVLAVAVLPNVARAQNLIQNSGFESGGANWTFLNSVVPDQYIDYGMTPTPAFGTEDAVFNAGDQTPSGVLSQSFATIPGANYTVSFVYGNFNANTSAGTQTVTAEAIDTNTAALLGSVVASDTAPGIQTSFAAVMDTTFTFGFTATGANTTLRFTDSPASQTISSDGILDNVSVVAVVPEAGTLALVAAGIAVGVGLVRRKPAA